MKKTMKKRAKRTVRIDWATLDARLRRVEKVSHTPIDLRPAVEEIVKEMLDRVRGL